MPLRCSSRILERYGIATFITFTPIAVQARRVFDILKITKIVPHARMLTVFYPKVANYASMYSPKNRERYILSYSRALE
jgi:hypothetical protein